jgi:antitoxin VapB
MTKSAIAKVFMTGRSQAVRLPKEFRFKGSEVRITKTDAGVLLEPIYKNADELWAAIDRITGGKFEFEVPEDIPLAPEDPFEDWSK